MQRVVIARVLASMVVAIAFLPTERLQAQPPPNRRLIDLSGLWDENGDEVDITDDGITIKATYRKESTCEFGGTVTPVHAEFWAAGASDQLEGKAKTCHEGTTAAGVVDDTIKLKVSSDGNTLSATQFVGTQPRWDFTLTRKCPADLKARFANPATQGPGPLLSACQGLLDQGVREECLHPYGCALADCFGSGAHYIEMAQATGPGLIGYPLVLLGLSGPGAVPSVKKLSVARQREPLLITRDSCGPMLFLLRDAKQVMERTAIFYSDLGDQQRAINECEDFCKSFGWRTTWP